MTDSTPTPDLKAITRTARDPAATAEQLQSCAGQGESIDRLLAKHTNASAQLLEQLSHSSDRATRKSVTLHPNTPKDALLKLAPQFPGDFFQNPAFDWLLIEHPNLMFDIGGGVLKNVLKRAECPSSFMAWAAAHGSEQERLAVAMNPQAQADVLQAIERKGGKAAQAAQQHANHPLASGEGDLESAFRKAVEQAISEGFTANDVPTLAQWPALSAGARFGATCFEYVSHPLAPPALTLSILSALASDPQSDARCSVAECPGTPADILALLAGDADSGVRKAVAKRPTALAASLTTLAGDSDGDVRCEVAGNTATPVGILAMLAGDSETWVRRAVAQNPATPADILAALACDADFGVRAVVAENAAIPASVLTTLASDSETSVCLGVAENPSTPRDIRLAVLVRLAGDASVWVCSSVVANPATPVAARVVALSTLAADAERLWRRKVAAHPDAPVAILATLAEDSDSYVRKNVAQNLATPAAVVAALAGDSDGWVRDAVAANPATAAEILCKLGSDASFAVRRAVAANPATPNDTLTALAIDAQWDVCWAVAKNPSAPPGVWASILPKLSDVSWGERQMVAESPLTPADILAVLAVDSVGDVRRGVANNPAAPAAILSKLLGDADSGVRAGVACHPATPPDILTTLACDAGHGVRHVVAWNAAAPAVALIQLAGDSDPELRWAVAGNPATPVDTAAKLVADLCAYAQTQAFEPRHSAQWTSQVAGLKSKEVDLIRACSEGDVLYLPDRLADKACRKTDLAWRVLGLSHRLASPEDLAKRSRSTEWVERMAVARNPNTPPNIIDELRKDPHRLVARQADATAALKSGAAERQSQLLQEMPVDFIEPLLIEETTRRLRTIRRRLRLSPLLMEVDYVVAEVEGQEDRLFGSRWSRCLAPGQWLMALSGVARPATQRFRFPVRLDAGATSRLERMLPASLKQAMAEFWVDAPVPPDEFDVVAPPGALALLAERSKKKDVHERIAANANAPIEVLARLATSRYESVRATVAANPATSAHSLATLSEDSDWQVRCGVAKNAAATCDILTRLAGDERYGVRSLVAKNPTTPADTLTKLADDEAEFVRHALVENAAAPAATLAVIIPTLAISADSWARRKVAANPAIPVDIRPAILAKLAADSDAPVRCEVASNPATPADVLAMLASDPESGVRCAVASNLATAAEVLTVLAGDSDAALRREVARNAATPVAILITLAGDEDSYVRCAVAANPSALSDVLRILAFDSDGVVGIAAVSNPNVPADILGTPTGDADADARRAGARRCAEIRRALATESLTPEQSAAIQSWIDELQAGCAEPVVLKDVSDSEFQLAFDALGLLPAEGDKRAIAKAAKSKDWLERAAATYAAGIQPSLLKVLLEDPVEAVRQCAVARLRVVVA